VVTRTDVMELWEQAERLAARMIELRIDRTRVDAWMATFAACCERMLNEIEAGT